MAIRSMTGYGQATADLTEARISVELRTLNHRYADLRLRLPSELSFLEPALRRKVLASVRRGRVEMNVNLEPTEAGEARPQLNLPLLDAVLEAREVLQERGGIAGELDLSAVVTVPGMWKSVATPVAWSEPNLESLDAAVDAALAALDVERRREGRHLAQELLSRLARMEQAAAQIRERAAKLPSLLRERLIERLDALSRDLEIDPGRVAQEAAVLADRSDVTEEIVRLEGHLSQVRVLLDEPDKEPLGKRIDFLLQEIHRETNTVNSKSADLELSRLALTVKAELEKVREQVQNIE